MTSCDDEPWALLMLSGIGRMSLDVAFDDGHSLDIGPWVEAGGPIQGVVFEKATSVMVEGESFGVQRVIRVTRAEVKFAQSYGTDLLISKLHKANVYPRTFIQRPSLL
jgi:hypothetical protein